MRAIGYWHEPPAEDALPDPRDFVDPGMPAAEKAAVVAYLRSGTAFAASAGFSTCRLCGAANGSGELTDGGPGFRGMVTYRPAPIPSSGKSATRKGNYPWNGSARTKIFSVF
ncbi:hypothetical protein AB0J83_00165 [Actinoplanes sp. NPDC049596]|uniref:hypothetical protein n=1 Tax=unclassified Actinoplanes TaxID=2626549 RepID=UPI00342D214F